MIEHFFWNYPTTIYCTCIETPRINFIGDLYLTPNRKNSISGGDLREIGRTVAAEVEKYFEAKINPRTIEKKAGRINATNVSPTENPATAGAENGVQGGTEITPDTPRLWLKKSFRRENLRSTQKNAR